MGVQNRIHKLFYVLFATMLVAVLALAGPLPRASAATPIYVRPGGDDTLCNGTVDVDYSPGDAPNCAVKTIQKGVDLAEPSGTVNVAAGTYNERITIGKSVSLRGAQFGVDPTAPGARTTSAAESIITEAGLSTPNPDVLIEIPNGVVNVTVDGFTLNGDQTNTTADTSVLRIWDDNITVRNNIIDGFYGVIYKGNNTLLVDQNRITVNKAGVVVQPNPASDVTVSDNTIALGTSPQSDPSSIYLAACTNCTVSGNTASGFVGRALQASGVSRLTVSGNTFTGNRDGISIFGVSTFITITDNDLSNSGRYGINIKGQDITINGNRIANNGDVGINVDKHLIDTQRVTIANNDLSGNTTLGVKVNTIMVSETINASGNWWGDDTPAGVAAEVSANVDYTPWLDVGADASTDPGFQGDFSTLNVDDDSPQTGSVGRIQEGVDLVTASTVHVVAGIYVEQVVITDSLTIYGDGAVSTFIQAPSTIPAASNPDSTIVKIAGAGVSVDFSGFTVAGPGPSGCGSIGSGIFVRDDAYANIHDNEILYIRDNPFSGCQNGVAILVGRAAFSTSGSVEISNNVISGYQKNGITVSNTGSSATVTNNTVTGAGATTTIAQNGIQVSGGATANITGNTVNGHSYTPFSYVSTGMLLYGAGPTNTSGNTVSENQVGIYVIDTPGSHDGNTVSASSAGTGSPGFWGIVVDAPPPAHQPDPLDDGMDSTALALPSLNSVQALANPVQVVTVTNNALTGDGTAAGIGLEADSGFGSFDIDLTATNNYIQNWGIGVEIFECGAPYTCTGTTFANLKVNLNSITGNLTGYDHYNASFTADGEKNWWDSPTGPTHAGNPGGTGDSASDDVDFTPWLCVGTDTSTDPGFQPNVGTLCPYQFTGFFQPIDMNAVNIAKAGQAIPVKWKLTDANGVPISDPSSFVGLYSYSVSCTDFNGAPPDAIETYSGSSGLQYLGDGYWQFNWKTPKTYANTCRTMYVQFQGGFKSPEVDFKFKP